MCLDPKAPLFSWDSIWLVSVIQRKLLFAVSQSSIIKLATMLCIKQRRAYINFFFAYNLTFLIIHHLEQTFLYSFGKILYAFLLQFVGAEFRFIIVTSETYIT